MVTLPMMPIPSEDRIVQHKGVLVRRSQEGGPTSLEAPRRAVNKDIAKRDPGKVLNRTHKQVSAVQYATFETV